MAKPKMTIWTPEPHTLAKHVILRRYLGGWFPILAQRGYNKRLVYIDGFAGPGVYDDGSPGSPIVALQTLLDHVALADLSGTEFIFIFIEQDDDRFDQLEAQIAALWEATPGGKPANVLVYPIHGDFGSSADEILTDLGGKNLAPTVAFVDPFGFSDVALDTLCRLTGYPKCEVLFSFMFDSVNRFIAHPQDTIQGHLQALFGTEEYLYANQLGTPAERHEYLHALYRHQLAKEGNFDYVIDFDMINLQGHNVYSLVYATRHLKGMEVMKDAMWKADPTGQYRFSDGHAAQTTLFGEEPDFEPLRNELLATFAGQAVPIEKIREFVLADTLFGASHFKRVLKQLQAEERIVDVANQRNRGTFPDGVVVHFAG